MSRWFICVAAVLMGAAVVLAEKPDSDQSAALPKSQQALAAVKRADEAVQAIKASCRKQIAATRRTEASQLQEAMTTATRSGDLDEALRIRAALQLINTGSHRMADDNPDQKYVGFWRMHANPSNGYILFSDGTARLTFSTDGKATWTVRGKEILVNWGGGTEDSFIQEDSVWVHRIYDHGKVVKTAPGEVDFPK